MSATISTPPVALSADDRAALSAIADSRIGAQIRAEAAEERAARRARIIEAFRKAEAAHRAEHRAKSAAADKLLPDVQAKHADWQRVAQEHATLQNAASAANDAADRAGVRAACDLRELGSEVIDRAVFELGFVEQEARTQLSWRVERDLDGKERTTLRQPELLVFAGRMRALRAELEAMKLAPVTPAEIDARCAAVLEEARQLTKPGKPDGPRHVFIVPTGKRS